MMGVKAKQDSTKTTPESVYLSVTKATDCIIAIEHPDSKAASANACLACTTTRYHTPYSAVLNRPPLLTHTASPLLPEHAWPAR